MQANKLIVFQLSVFSGKSLEAVCGLLWFLHIETVELITLHSCVLL